MRNFGSSMKELNPEKWLPVKGYEELYRISNFGAIYSVRSGKLRKFSQSTPYDQVTLFNKGKACYLWVHRLVAQHFVSNAENKPVVNHIDGNKRNNHAANLEWVTDAENNAHAGEMNLKPIGTKHVNSKFSKRDLELIKVLASKGMSGSSIARMLKVNHTTINNFLGGRTYKKENFNA